MGWCYQTNSHRTHFEKNSFKKRGQRDDYIVPDYSNSHSDVSLLRVNCRCFHRIIFVRLARLNYHGCYWAVLLNAERVKSQFSWNGFREFNTAQMSHGQRNLTTAGPVISPPPSVLHTISTTWCKCNIFIQVNNMRTPLKKRANKSTAHYVYILECRA